jgi:zinc protease
MVSVTNFSDTQLWASVLGNDRDAFETLVERYQSAVTAIAYSVCGDFAQSEDIAQDTFLTAWHNRGALHNPEKLGSWLCGIARNKARNSRRSQNRFGAFSDDVDSLPSQEQPLENVVSEEESELVRQALVELPEHYREPLVLYYREDQSVADVARSLDLSEAAVRQRLVRGREMLREQMLEVVERSLRATRPTASFTAKVMAGLFAVGVSVKTAVAASAASTAFAATKASPAFIATASKAGMVGSVGFAGAIGGAVVGILGGYLGSWIPAQLAPTARERDEHLRIGRRMLVVSIIASIVLLGALVATAGNVSGWGTTAIVIAWIVAFMTYCLCEGCAGAVRIARIRQLHSPESDPNNSFARQFIANRQQNGQKVQWEGRVYRSSASFLGLPLVDIQVATPSMDGKSSGPRHARGWIAIGDRATGIIAVGGIAKGIVSVGGLSIGVFSFGGISLGLLSFGGLALGGIAIGGLGIGWLGMGGVAAGWNALGGGAIAWDTACGGGALAHHAAFGGAAVASEIAVGGNAIAIHANDDVAKAFFENHWMKNALTWTAQHSGLFMIITLVVSFVPMLLMLPLAKLMYRRIPVAATETTSE